MNSFAVKGMFGILITFAICVPDLRVIFFKIHIFERQKLKF